MRQNMPLRQQPQQQTETEIMDCLLRLAKLYQIPNFDAESAVLLAEWVMDEYKHTHFEIVKQALTRPPLPKQSDNKSWRLTPETIGDWIEVTRTRIIEDQQRKESEARQSKPIEYPKINNKAIDELLNKTISELKKEITFKPSQIANDVKAIKIEDKERIEGRKALSHNRMNFSVLVQDSEGNDLGVIENVLAESQEQANEIVTKLINSGQIKI